MWPSTRVGADAPYGDRVEMAQQFLPLLGQWTGLEKQEASPWSRATTARASFVFKLDVAGTVVVQDYRQVRADGGELTGHGVFLAEPGTDTVLWWFFDSYAQVPLPATGRWQPDGLELEKVTPRGRARHRFAAEDARLDYQIEVFLGAVSGWAPFLSGTYRRVSGH
jgi:hypothetical protein